MRGTGQTVEKYDCFDEFFAYKFAKHGIFHHFASVGAMQGHNKRHATRKQKTQSRKVVPVAYFVADDRIGTECANGAFHTERFRITVKNRRQRTDVKAGNAVFHGGYFGACVNDTDTKTFYGKQTRQVSDESRFSAAGARRYHGIFYSFAVRYIPRSEFGTAEKCVSHAVIERRNIFYAQNLSLIGNGAAANPDAMPAVKRNKPIPYARSISMDGVFAGAQKTFVKNLVRYAYRIAVGTSKLRKPERESLI